MSCGSCGPCGGSCCGVCKAIGVLVTLLVTVITLVAAYGAYLTHKTADGWMFGSLNGSVSLLVLLASLVTWKKLVKHMCPCSSGGMCGGCGKSPCVCH